MSKQGTSFYAAKLFISGIFSIILFTGSPCADGPQLLTRYQFAYVDTNGICRIVLHDHVLTRDQLIPFERLLLENIFLYKKKHFVLGEPDNEGFQEVIPTEGRGQSVWDATDVCPGDKFVIQKPTAKGDGPYAVVEVQSIHYRPGYYYEAMRLEARCTPHIDPATFEGESVAKRGVLRGQRYRDLHSETIPEIVKKRAAERALEWYYLLDDRTQLETWWWHEDAVSREDTLETIMSIQPFRSKLGNGGMETYFFVVFRAGEKACASQVLIFNNEGLDSADFHWSTEAEIGEPVGITDVDKDGQHEIMLRFGGYGGGGKAIIAVDESGKYLEDVALWFMYMD